MATEIATCKRLIHFCRFWPPVAMAGFRLRAKMCEDLRLLSSDQICNHPPAFRIEDEAVKITARRKLRRTRSCCRLAVTLLALTAVLLAARQVCAATSNPVTVTIVSPGNGGGAPGQTLQAGVFAIKVKNDQLCSLPFVTCPPVDIKSITISFSNPSLFSSATLTLVKTNTSNTGPNWIHLNIKNPPPATPPAASTTFVRPGGALLAVIPAGQQAVFSLTVKLSPLSLNQQGKVAYAGMMVGPYRKRMGAPLWIAFAMMGLAMMTLPGWTRRRAWLLAAMVILLAAGAPGCGGDSSPSSTQTVTAVTEQPATAVNGVYYGTPTPPAGLPLTLGTITGQ